MTARPATSPMRRRRSGPRRPRRAPRGGRRAAPSGESDTAARRRRRGYDAPPMRLIRALRAPAAVRAPHPRRARPALGDRAERRGRAADRLRARLPGLAALRRRRRARPAPATRWIEYSNRVLSGIVMVVAVLTWVVARRVPGAPAAHPALGGRDRGGDRAPGPAGRRHGPHGPAPAGRGLALPAVDGRPCLRHDPGPAGARLGGGPRARRWDRRRGADGGRGGAGGGRRAGHRGGRHRGGTALGRRRRHRALRRPAARDPGARARGGGLRHPGRRARGLGLARGRRPTGVTAWLAAVALPLVAIQIGLGEYQYRNGLPWEVVVFHVTIAALLWAVVVAACWGVARPGRRRPTGRREATLWQGTQRTASGSARSRPSGISAPQSTQTP